MVLNTQAFADKLV